MIMPSVRYALLLASCLALPALAANNGMPPANAQGSQSTAPAAEPVVPEGPSAAAPAQTATLSDLGRSLRDYFSEDELALLFEYMRDSVIAAFKGDEVYLPPDLAFKLEVLMVRMKKEGGHYMDNLIRQLERDLARNLKEKLKPPPIKEKAYEPPPFPKPLPPPTSPPASQIAPPPPMLPPGLPMLVPVPLPPMLPLGIPVSPPGAPIAPSPVAPAPVAPANPNPG